MRKMWKRILSVGLCLAMVMGLVACNKGDKWIFSLNGEMLYSKDVAAFAYIYITEYNVKNVEQLDEIYEDTTTYGEYYKQQLEEDIITTVLLYKEANNNKIKLSDEMKQQIESRTDSVLERFGKGVLEEKDVSKADIENIYEMKLLGEAYLDGLFEVEDAQDETSASVTDERYVKVYQVTFPTVQLDDEGMLQSNEDGTLKKLSVTEIAEKEQEAMTFAENAKQGEDMDKLLRDCDATVTGIEKYLKYEDLEAAYQSEVDKLSVGEVSDVIHSDYGFYVIRLLEKDDSDYAETVENHEEQTATLSAKETELERLYSEYAQANKEYKNVSVWNEIDVRNYVK